MTDPTTQSRLEDALRDVETQRAELVRLRERAVGLEAELASARAIGTRLARCHDCGASFAPLAGEVTCAACAVRRSEIAAASRPQHWPEYRAESDSK